MDSLSNFMDWLRENYSAAQVSSKVTVFLVVRLERRLDLFSLSVVKAFRTEAKAKEYVGDDFELMIQEIELR